MSGRGRAQQTRFAVGPLRLVTYRQERGYGIIDSRTGRPAYTESHPVSGRPIVALVPDVHRALLIAQSILEAEE